MITEVRLQHFRSYTDGSFEIGSGVNIIVGPNASGKTNLLEAIMVASIGGSYRSRDAELVQFEHPWARIDLTTPTDTRTVKLVAEGDKVKKDFVIQGTSLKRLQLARTIPTVLFEPNHLQLLTGSPELRRDYLDDLLEQTVVGYSTLRSQYRRTLAQRNRLLKLGRTQADAQLFAWNIRLSQLGGEIAKHRIELVDKLSGLQTIYQDLSHSKAKVTVEYVSSCHKQQYSSDMLHRLETETATDIERGFTSRGPHRDDMRIMIDGRPLQDVASRGETRTALLALKILELQLVEQARDQKPLLLLDDVFSELDGARRRALTEVLKGYQSFITTTDADIVVKHFTEACTIIPLGSTEQ